MSKQEPKWAYLKKYRGVRVYYAVNKAARAEMGENVAVYEHGEIFVRDPDPSDSVLRHEYRHAQQHRTWGVLFYPAYLFCHLVFGYDGNPFEVDAVAYERKRRG